MNNLKDIVKNCFDQWLKNEAEGFANFTEDAYAIPNNEHEKTKGKPPYCWRTLNAVLKTEADVQMRFGMALDQCLRKKEKELGKSLFVRCEMKLQDIGTVDLSIYEKPQALWLSKTCSHPNYGEEAEKYLRAIIEVKLVDWRMPFTKWYKKEFGGGIGKDMKVFENAKTKWPKLPLFYLMLDESYLNSFWRCGTSAKAAELQTHLQNLKDDCQKSGVVWLSNNP